MTDYIKILTRAELNNYKNSELDDLLRLLGIRKGINVSSGTRDEKIDSILANYKLLYDSKNLFIAVKKSGMDLEAALKEILALKKSLEESKSEISKLETQIAILERQV